MCYCNKKVEHYNSLTMLWKDDDNVSGVLESHFSHKLCTDLIWIFISSCKLKLPNGFSYLKDFGTNSHIFGPNEERIMIQGILCSVFSFLK